MDNKFKKIIEYKKQKGSIRKPKYATRKLSIGLVSCMLGYALLVSPSSVEAAELDSENQAVAEESAETETTTEDNLVEESEKNKEETPAPAEEEKPAETTENTDAPTEKETTEEAPNSEEDAVSEEDTVVEEKEVFKLKEEQRQALEDADFTDSEIAEIEKEIANKLEADSSLNPQTLVDEKISEKTATLEMDEEVKPEAVAAADDENRAPKDISNEVTNINGSIEGLTNEDATTIKPIAQDTNLARRKRL